MPTDGIPVVMVAVYGLWFGYALWRACHATMPVHGKPAPSEKGPSLRDRLANFIEGRLPEREPEALSPDYAALYATLEQHEHDTIEGRGWYDDPDAPPKPVLPPPSPDIIGTLGERKKQPKKKPKKKEPKGRYLKGGPGHHDFPAIDSSLRDRLTAKYAVPALVAKYIDDDEFPDQRIVRMQAGSAGMTLTLAGGESVPFYLQRDGNIALGPMTDVTRQALVNLSPTQYRVLVDRMKGLYDGYPVHEHFWVETVGQDTRCAYCGETKREWEHPSLGTMSIRS